MPWHTDVFAMGHQCCVVCSGTSICPSQTRTGQPVCQVMLWHIGVFAMGFYGVLVWHGAFWHTDVPIADPYGAPMCQGILWHIDVRAMGLYVEPMWCRAFIDAPAADAYGRTSVPRDDLAHSCVRHKSLRGTSMARGVLTRWSVAGASGAPVCHGILWHIGLFAMRGVLAHWRAYRRPIWGTDVPGDSLAH